MLGMNDGYEYMTNLTRSMSVSAVVMFLLFDRSDSSLRCSWPPPGLTMMMRMEVMKIKVKYIYPDDDDNVPDGDNEDDAKDDGKDGGHQIVDNGSHPNLSG